MGIHKWGSAKEEVVGTEVKLVIRCKDCDKVKKE
jgi:hypothetical protein